MSDVIWCVTTLTSSIHFPICSGSNHCGGTKNKIMYNRHTFCCKTETISRQQNIIINQSRSMIYFDKDILAFHTAF